ncbi:YfcC family protein [Algoriphagus aestuarii]|nr:YfcC family protein [Algoriphagus aestuarii]
MKLSFPHPLIIMLIFIIFSGLSTFFIQSGEFNRELNEETGREVVIAGSFHEIEDKNTGINDLLLSIPEGIVLGGEILVLILLIGGAFYVIEKTGALQIGIEALIYTFRKQQTLLLFLLGCTFALCGATLGMQEEIIAMVPILVVLANKLHYDLRALIALSLGSALVGGSISPINPFGSLIALKIAELDLSNGFWFRLCMALLIITAWNFYHIRQGKLKTDQTLQIDFKPVEISLRNKLILFLMSAAIVAMGWGIFQFDWSYNQMSALFFVVGFACGIIGKLGINGTARAYTEGFGEMIFAGVIVGLARSIYIILDNASVIDPIIQGMFEPLNEWPSGLAAIGMLIVQAIIHIPVPSTSGHAVLTMPLAAPLADLLGMSRFTAVMAYQFGAGFMDILTPTNGGMMAVLAAASVSYKNWFSYIWKSMLLLMLLALISVILGMLYYS